MEGMDSLLDLEVGNLELIVECSMLLLDKTWKLLRCGAEASEAGLRVRGC